MVLTASSTLESYFDPQLSTALDGQAVHADEHVRHYLLTLLVRSATEVPPDQSLVELELCARAGDRQHRCRALRQLGDHALFTTGLFCERLRRRGISPRYYCDKGRSAYAESAGMAARGHGVHAHALRALARRFEDFVCVLRQVREDSGLSEPRDAHGLLKRSPDLHAACWQPRADTTVQ